MNNSNKNNSNKADAKMSVIMEDAQYYNEDKLTNHYDLCKKYIHEIRNIKILDKEMINNIRNMSNEDKMDIIISFNDVVDYLIKIIEC